MRTKEQMKGGEGQDCRCFVMSTIMEASNKFELSIHKKRAVELSTKYERNERNESRWWREGHEGNCWKIRRGGKAWMNGQKWRAIHRGYIRSHRR